MMYNNLVNYIFIIRLRVLGLQRDQTSPSYRKSVLNICWKNWCWSWNSKTLATWCKELTYWKRPWCWERLRAGGERDDRGWDGWMASPTQWMSLSRLWELVMDREAFLAGVHAVTDVQTWLSYWNELKQNWHIYLFFLSDPSRDCKLKFSAALSDKPGRQFTNRYRKLKVFWGFLRGRNSPVSVRWNM